MSGMRRPTLGTHPCRFRVKDLERSLDFYTRVLGFTVLEKLDFKEAKFSLVFLGQCNPKEIPTDPSDRVRVPPEVSFQHQPGYSA